MRLINGREFQREYQLDDGRIITIDIADDSEIIIRDSENNIIGRFELRRIEYDNSEEYHLTWMYLDLKDKSYKYKGIGRTALTYFKDVYGNISASNDDGIKKNDGSHLTEDAPGFVSKMRDEGIINDNYI